MTYALLYVVSILAAVWVTWEVATTPEEPEETRDDVEPGTYLPYHRKGHP